MARTQLSRSTKVKARTQLWLLISKNSGEETEGEACVEPKPQSPALGVSSDNMVSAYQLQHPIPTVSSVTGLSKCKCMAPPMAESRPGEPSGTHLSSDQ